jgi:hypothetical protein
MPKLEGTKCHNHVSSYLISTGRFPKIDLRVVQKSSWSFQNNQAKIVPFNKLISNGCLFTVGIVLKWWDFRKLFLVFYTQGHGLKWLFIHEFI